MDMSEMSEHGGADDRWYRVKNCQLILIGFIFFSTIEAILEFYRKNTENVCMYVCMYVRVVMLCFAVIQP